jgi:hypothetical protein
VGEEYVQRTGGSAGLRVVVVEAREYEVRLRKVDPPQFEFSVHRRDFERFYAPAGRPPGPPVGQGA